MAPAVCQTTSIRTTQPSLKTSARHGVVTEPRRTTRRRKTPVNISVNISISGPSSGLVRVRQLQPPRGIPSQRIRKKKSSSAMASPKPDGVRVSRLDGAHLPRSKSKNRANHAATPPPVLVSRGGRVRDACMDDLDAIVDIHVRAAPEIEVVRYRYPHTAAHQAVYREMTREKYAAEILGAEAMRGTHRGTEFKVYEVETRGERPASPSHHAVIGFAIWTNYSDVDGAVEPDREASLVIDTTLPEGISEADAEKIREMAASHHASDEAAGHTLVRGQVRSPARYSAFDLYNTRYIQQVRARYPHGLFWLRMLCVLPQHRNKGVGEALVLDGIRSLDISTDDSVRHRAVGLYASPKAMPLYKRLLFEEVGSLTLQLPEELDDAVDESSGGGRAEEPLDKVVVRCFILTTEMRDLLIRGKRAADFLDEEEEVSPTGPALHNLAGCYLPGKRAVGGWRGCVGADNE